MTNNITNEKSQDLFFLILLIIISLALGAENNIYVQSFPQLTKYLNINESNTEDLLRISFAGSCLSGFIIGPLADSYGRKKIFITGLFLYTISSIFCLLSTNFINLLFWRFIEGIARTIPLMIGWIIVFDKFSIAKSGKLIGLVKGTSTFLLALMPILSFFMSKSFGWHSSFLLISAFALIALIGSMICVEETLAFEKRKAFNLLDTFKTYFTLLKNFEFSTYIIIYSLGSATYTLFFSNAAIVFIDHLGMSKKAFSLFQFLNSAIYIAFSFLSVYLINKKDIDYTANLGFATFIIGCVLIFALTMINENNFNAIFYATMIISAGNALMNGFLLKSIKLFPDMKGSAMSLYTIITLIFSARTIRWSQIFFNETIMPTAIIILCCAIISVALITILHYKKNLN